MKKPSNAAVAQENVSRLASIGLRAIAFDHARAAAIGARRALRAARRNDEETTEHDHQYAAAAKVRANVRTSMLREIRRYKAWLDEVNGGRQ